MACARQETAALIVVVVTLLGTLRESSSEPYSLRTHCLSEHAQSTNDNAIRGGTSALENWSPEAASGPGQLGDDATWPPWWNLSLLSRTVTQGSFEQMGPLLAKLERGHAVTVLAWGTSITSDHGGCYHDSMEHMKAMMPNLPNNYARGEFAKGPVGWLSHFMHDLNSTYPNPHHLLINAGNPGSDANYFANSECIETYLPHTLDLVIFESLDMLHTETKNMERLILRLQHHYGSRPPIVVINTVRSLNLGPGITFPGQNGFGIELKSNYQCIADGGRQSGARNGNNLCRTLCATNFTSHIAPESFRGIKAQSEAASDIVAQYYGFASLSVRAFLHNAIAVRETEGYSTCEVLSSLFVDVVHPGLDGKLLLSHIMTNYMAEAAIHLRRTGWLQSSDDPVEKPLIAGGWTPPPLQGGGGEGGGAASLYVAMRCYGDLSAEQDMEKSIAEALQGSWSVEENNGWSYVVYQMHGETKKFKPGWVATAPGSELSIKVNSRFSGASEDSIAKVQLSHLVSYEHMGQAQVSCVSGCECEGMLVDAHDGRFQQSITQSATLLVTMSEECVIKLVVMHETSSGGHKFKLQHVTTSAEILRMDDAAHRHGSNKL